MIEEPLWGPETGWLKSNNWNWCDALFMAPPGMAMVAKATGQQKYLDLMDRLYWDTYDYLYDKEENLFYRDTNYMADHDGYQLRSSGGKKIFWGRGNGWVLAGLARTLEYLPKDYPSYSKYVELFREMSNQICLYQQKDGLWRASLNEPTWFPSPETSSSGMFCFALAFGINNGLLDKQKFMPVVTKAWEGLVTCVRDDGKMQWVQPTGIEPRKVYKDDSVEYGCGAFLLAGNEMIKLHKRP
jgi:rhamnogalacturonyl hydrolase YesR